MADKTVIIRLDVQEAGAEAQVVNLNNKLSKLTKGSQEYELTVKKIAIQEERLSAIQSKRAKIQSNVLTETKKTTKVLGKQSDATGSATAATMELSRVVSDAPYGIRGMANNITQLVSQLGTASTKAGGFTAALKLMWKSMMGPLGVVFAITAVVSLIDYLYGANTKATNSVGKLKDEFQSFADLLDKNVNASIEDYIKLMADKVLLDKEGIKTAKKLKKIEEERAGIKYSLARSNDFDLLTKLRKREIVLEGEVAKIYKKGAEAIREYNEQKELLTAATAGTIDSFKQTITKLTKERSATAQSSAGWDFYTKKIEIYQELIDKINGKNSAKKGSVEFLEKQKSELQKTQKELSTTSEKWGEYAQKIKKVQDAIDKITKGNEREKVDILGLASIDIGETKKKMKKILDSVADAMNVDLKKDPLKIAPELDMELSDEIKQRLSDKLKEDIKETILNSQLEDAENFLKDSKKVISAITDFTNAEFERELTIEQNKTNALNTELNNRLLNENLSKEQRASIQNEIAQNDEKLRVKQEKIERKKFETNKAANIATALIDTSMAAVGVMKDAKGGFFARLAQAIPTIAFGLAQVASISRQKFQSSGSKSPINVGGGGNSSSSERSEPSFNVVGRSGDSILLNAIQAQFDKPLKAYVVSRDVTNQQQLDGVISTEAGT